MTETKWITTGEACQISDYHPDHLRVLIRARKIRAQKFGPVWQIDHDSLVSFLEASKEKGQKRGRKKIK
ncbi:MAG: helix-turn-helix domain-containing protein [Anaerolineales bacterium]|nr:helix-turn-helix domain-containing protein [Candidatus Brocadiales bacterium]MBL6983021.1 helix-turn-helix domain-containing protein [Anaerolineales bacterium]